MKVYLINPDYMLYGNPPLGLAYLASYLRKEIPFLDIKILDQIPCREIITKIKQDRPDVVGLTAVSENWFKVKKLGKIIRNEVKNSKIIIGGVHLTSQPSCFKKSAFDYGILGEGELPFAHLIKLIQNKNCDTNNLGKIKGILFRQEGKVINTGISEQIQNMDDLPPPALELLNMQYYSIPHISSGLFKKSFHVLTSRGCPHNCKFCSSSCFWGRKIRFFSAERVVNEIENLYRRHKFNKINIGDDLFSINEQRLKAIVEGLRKKCLLGKIEFSCCGRADSFSVPIVKKLKEMGVTEIFFGFESGSEKALKWLKGEGMSVEMNKKAIELCKQYEITPFGFFVIGSPYETLEDMKKTGDFIRAYCRTNFIIFQTIAYPGTEVWEYGIKNKIIPEDMYERETRGFAAKDTRYLLTKEVSRENFEKVYNEIKNLNIKNDKSKIINNLKNIDLKNLKGFFKIIFIKKMWALRKRFFNKLR